MYVDVMKWTNGILSEFYKTVTEKNSSHMFRKIAVEIPNSVLNIPIFISENSETWKEQILGSR